jgi:bifunctional non-homologous end joining protein LigD
MGISVPVSWEELPRLTSGAEWTLENIHARLAVGNSPWEAYRPQPLARAIKILGYSED